MLLDDLVFLIITWLPRGDGHPFGQTCKQVMRIYEQQARRRYQPTAITSSLARLRKAISEKGIAHCRRLPLLHHACFHGNMECVLHLHDVLCGGAGDWAARFCRVEAFDLNDVYRNTMMPSRDFRTTPTTANDATLQMLKYQHAFKYTPLHIACLMGHVDVCKHLLHRNKTSFVDVTTNTGETALHLTVKTDNFELASLLLGSGASVSCADRMCLKPVHLVLTGRMLHLLTRYGASPSARGINSGEQLIHYAAERGSCEVLEALHSHYHLDLEARTDNSLQAVHYATWYGRCDVLECFSRWGLQLESQTINGWRPVHYACYHANLSALKHLHAVGCNMSPQNLQGWTPLQIGVTHSQIQVARFYKEIGLFHAGSPVNAQYGACKFHGLELMHLACFGKGKAAMSFVAYLHEECGLSLGVRDRDGCTTMHHAVANGAFELVKFLHKHGVAVTTENYEAQKPLDYLCEMMDAFHDNRIELSSHEQKMYQRIEDYISGQRS